MAIENARLRRQVEELTAANAALQNELSKLRSSGGAHGDVPSWHSILNGIPGMTATLAGDGSVEIVNEKIFQYTGQRLDQLKDWGTNGTVHPDDIAHVKERFWAGIKSGEPYSIEQRLRGADGTYRWFSNRGVPEKDAGGRVLRWYVLLVDIDEQKKAEETLRESERSWRAFVDGIPGCVATLEPNGYVRSVNQHLLDYLGVSIETMQDWGTNGIVHVDDVPHASEVFGKALAVGAPYEFEHRLRRHDGSYRWFVDRGIPVRDSAGQVTHYYALLADIDDQRRAADHLRLVDAIPGLLAVFSPSGEAELLNEPFLSYLGQTTEEFGAHWPTNGTVHPDDLARHINALQHSLKTGQPIDFETRLRRHDGVYRWFQLRGNPARNSQGDITQWYCLMSDIDDRKRAEEALRESEHELKTLVDTIPAGIGVLAPSGEVIGLNRHILNYFGLSDEQLRDWASQNILHPDDVRVVADTMVNSLTTGVPYDTEQRLRGADGNYRWFRVRGLPLRDAEGKILRWYALHADIDDQKRLEENLRESERQTRLIVDSIPGYITVQSASGDLEQINQPFFEYLGSKDALSQWQEGIFTHPDDRHVLERLTQTITEGAPFELLSRVRRNDGTYRWFQSRVSPLRDADGKISKWYGIHVDVDDRKRAEDALLESERKARSIVENIPGYVLVLSSEGYIEQVNSRYLDYIGFSLEDARRAMADRNSDYQDPEYAQQTYDAFARGMSSGQPFEVSARVKRADGAYRWIRSYLSPARDEAGNIVNWYDLLLDVDDSKRAEDALVESQRQALLTVDSIPGYITVQSPDGHIEHMNQPLFDYLGADTVTLAQWDQGTLTHPDDEHLLRRYVQGFHSDEPFEVEIRVKRFDGEYRWFQSRLAPLRDEAGRVVKWYGIHNDVDDRKRAEEALAASELQLRSVLDGMPILVTATDPAGHVTYVNRPITDYTGVSAEDLHLVGTSRIVHPDHYPLSNHVIRRAIANGEPYQVEQRIRRHDGEYRWFDTRGLPIRDEHGAVTGWYVLSADIEHRKQAEQVLAESESNLKTTIDTIPVMAWAARLDGTAEYLNKHYVDYMGRSMDDLLGDGWAESVHPDDKAELFADWQAMMDTGIGGVTHARIKRYDGEYRWFIFRTNPLRDASGKIIRWYGVNTDIEEHKQTEERLRRAHEHLNEAQRLSRTGSFTADLIRDIHHWSDEFYRICDFDVGGEVNIARLGEVIHPDDMLHYQGAIQRALSGVDPEFTFRIITKKGALKHLRGVAHRFDAPDGPVFLGAIQDITETKVAEEALGKTRAELAHVARVTALSTLTASIAHEINQPLAGIITNASTSLRMLGADPPNIEGAIETARRTIRDGNRASDIIKRLRALFQKKTSTENVDLSEAAREVIALAASEIRNHRAEMEVSLSENLPTIAGDKVQLQQVILNLLLNAADALSGIEDGPRRILIKTELDADENVRLTVQDTGIGISQETAKSLFDAFYTTKDTGMGIGLSVSRSIIEHHHGQIWATANNGPGASFSFTLPCSPTPPRQPSSPLGRH